MTALALPASLPAALLPPASPDAAAGSQPRWKGGARAAGAALPRPLRFPAMLGVLVETGVPAGRVPSPKKEDAPPTETAARPALTSVSLAPALAHRVEGSDPALAQDAGAARETPVSDAVRISRTPVLASQVEKPALALPQDAGEARETPAQETVAALAQAIVENRGKELIFLDTPGLGFGDPEDFCGLGHFLATRPDIDVHLVLSSSMKSADLTRVVDAFEILRLQRLLLTRLDETGSYGPILNEAARTGKLLSFFATGQRIPEDLEAVSRSRLAELILAGPSGRTRLAA